MNAKERLLYTLQYMLENTDEDHRCKVSDIQAMLARNGLDYADRKVIVDDLRNIASVGYDIVGFGTKYYYMASREFETAELRLLIDSVQYSKFITSKKTRSLIKKIESLTSRYEAEKLSKQVVFHESSKSMNETVYYNVDTLTRAVVDDRRIRFKYFEYTLSGKQYRKNGAYYEVSPYAMIVDDENYYLLAYDDGPGQLRHYRIDKMEDIQITGKKRLGREEFEKEDMSRYSSRVFGMFKGEEKDVKFRFANNLLGAARDVLGNDLMFIPDGDSHFTVHARVEVSPHFFGWVFAMGPDAEILEPADVRQEMKQMIAKAGRNYTDKKD